MILAGLAWRAAVRSNSEQQLAAGFAKGAEPLFAQHKELLEKALRSEAALARQEARDDAALSRRELGEALQALREAATRDAQAGREEIARNFNQFEAKLATRLDELNRNQVEQADRLRQRVQERLESLQAKNDERLEKMQQMVEEKLQKTLEARLGESFRQVSERLEQVHKGLGEMQSLASGVGDLKRTLSNIKTRGTWGEYQLGSMLEQVLAPGQFEQNVKVNPRSAEMVEFAIRLPGQDDTPIWLPIDAKFPVEDYQRLQEAAEQADAAAVQAAQTQLINRVKLCAKDVAAKYVCPPHTTPFAIIFLPTEGLYAEVARAPGLIESLQHDHKVTITGPSTLLAHLSALQMGFRTLAIQQRSVEVWHTLGAVKTEFGKFGVALQAVKKKLEEAHNKIEQTETRHRVMDRKLRGVEGLPEAEAARLLGDSQDPGEESEDA
ncbi:MAG: DNA recombination protein RmuC [Deltaproteobacteria bacterium]|nr:MAG: DNA recombination protein RmuC [Deltaproteobacteria bacterium]